jgi:hypothetical protein
LDINTTKLILEASFHADDAVLIEGAHGIGKSEIVAQFAEEQNFHFEDLRLSNNDVGDLIGIPHTIESKGKTLTTWSTPIWLERMFKANEEGKHCVLFLDELNRAPIDVRQCALQLVLEKRIHEHKLPELDGARTFIVAAINPSDDYQVDELDPALVDRFLHIVVDVDAKAWLNWSSGKVNPIVRDFIVKHPDRLHYTPDEGVGTSPRSFTKLGNYIDNAKDISDDILFSIIKGKIGKEVGTQFYSFMVNYTSYIGVEEIEKIVQEQSENVKSIDDLAVFISKKIENIESIQKTELASKLLKKYSSKKYMMPFLAFMYAVPIEVCVSFLKSLRKDDPEAYKKIVKFDTEINDKLLFKRIIHASDNG